MVAGNGPALNRKFNSAGERTGASQGEVCLRVLTWILNWAWSQAAARLLNCPGSNPPTRVSSNPPEYRESLQCMGPVKVGQQSPRVLNRSLASASALLQWDWAGSQQSSSR